VAIKFDSNDMASTFKIRRVENKFPHKTALNFLSLFLKDVFNRIIELNR